MESKVPFIAEYDPYSITRPLKRYRPISTRPWTLSFFLAATGICFGLLLALSLVEKDPIPSTKRDIHDVHQRYALFQRQDSAAATSTTLVLVTTGNDLAITSQAAASTAAATSDGQAAATTILESTATAPGAEISIASQSQCTVYVTLAFTECSASSGYACPTTTDPPAAAATTGSCVTVTEAETITAAASLLAVTSQSQCIEAVTETITSCVAPSGYVCPAATTSTPAAAATIGTCSTTTVTEIVTETASLLSIASQTQCTDFVVATVIICIAESGYYCPEPATTTEYPAAATTDDCSTTTTYATVTTTGSLLSIVSPTPDVSSAMASSLLSIGSSAFQSAVSSSFLSVGSQTPTSTPTPSPPPTPTPVLTVSPTPLASPASQSSSASQSFPPVSQITDSNGLLSVGSQTANPSTLSTLVGATDTQDLLSVGTQSASSSAVTSGVYPLVNPLATTSSSTPVSTTMFTVYTLTFEDLTETLSLYSDQSTIMTATSGTYLIEMSSNVIEASLFAASSSVPLLNQGASFTRTNSPNVPTSITTIPTSTLTTSSATSTSSQTLNPGLQKDLVLVRLSTFHPYYYFLAVYLPKILAVIMAVLWGVIFSGLKLMEPFYQLSAHTGALAKDTMFGNYLASELNLMSLSSTFHGQWVLLLGGAITIVWSAIVAFASEGMSVISLGRCRGKDGKHYRCDPAWAVSPKILMVLLVLTGLAFVLILILMLILSQRKRPSCFHNPSSIAAMAELLGNPQVMKDLRSIKPSSSDRKVKLLLGDNKYKIGLYDPSSGKEAHESQHDQSRWGLIKLEEGPINQKIARRTAAGYSAVLNPTMVIAEEEKANRKRRIFQLIYDLFMLVLALAVFGIILAYYLDDSSDPFNNFFNSAVFGPQFVLSCMGLILSMGWRRMSQEIVLMAPYRSMAKAYQAKSGVTANRSILARPARSPWVALFRGLRLRYYMVSVVAICAVLADILLIAVSGVPYNSGQTHLSLWISSYVSLAVLGVMILTAIAVLIYNRTSAGGTRKLPRSPDTLLGVWLYLCHSKLVPSLDNSNLDEYSSPLDEDGLKAKYQHYQCGFHRKTGMDRVRWWTIDSIYGLNSDPIPAMPRPYAQYQGYNSQFDNDTHQTGPQSYEASATPIENPYTYFPSQNTRPQMATSTATAPQPDTTYNISLPGPQSQRRRHRLNPTIPFEAQAKSPAPQAAAPVSGFEEVRPERHQILRVIPAPQRPVQSRSRSEEDETAITPQEALMQYEYEQEFHGGNGGTGRRASAGSSLYSQDTRGNVNSNGRWTNDGRSQYRYG